MNRERLEILLNDLKTNKDESLPHFSIDEWYVERDHCGTVSCVAGRAALIPDLQNQGLKLHKFVSIKEGSVRYTDPDGFMWSGFPATLRFFDLTRSQNQYIFAPSGYEKQTSDVTLEDAIQHIEDVLAGKIE